MIILFYFNNVNIFFILIIKKYNIDINKNKKNIIKSDRLIYKID